MKPTTSGCPRKGERVLVLWLEPGSSTSLTLQEATVVRAMPSRGLFIAELPAVDADGLRRPTVDVDEEGFGWKRLGSASP